MEKVNETTLELHMSSFKQALGQQIREAREERGVSQTALADAINRRQGYISDLENGKGEPSFRTLLALSIALEKPLLYFIPPGHRSFFNENSESEQAYLPEEEQLIMTIRELNRIGTFSFGRALHLVKALAEYDLEVEKDRL